MLTKAFVSHHSITSGYSALLHFGRRYGCLCAAVMAAKSAQGMRPVLLKIYYRQMTAYQLSIKAFIEGYKEGVKQPVDLDFILDEWEKATAPDKQQPPESAAQKADASQAERPSDSIEKATSTQVGRLENPRDSAHGEAKPGRGVRNDVNRQAQRGQEREVDMMSASDIDEWNARIMAESSQTSESGSKLQSASLDKQSDGHRSSTTGSDAETSADQQVSRMTLTEPRLPSTSNKNVEPATSFEQDISDALAEAERLARLMQKGTITPQQMRDFQKAVARADVMLSNAR